MTTRQLTGSKNIHPDKTSLQIGRDKYYHAIKWSQVTQKGAAKERAHIALNTALKALWFDQNHLKKAPANNPRQGRQMLNQPDSVSSRARQIKNLLRSTFELAILAEFWICLTGLDSPARQLWNSGSHSSPVWHHQKFKALLSVEAPESLNPNLWRHAPLNNYGGLIKICDGAW